VLSSDAGQPDSPPAPEALLRLVEALAAEGLDEQALAAAASELPQALVG
jgi:TolA-binding protein